MGVTYLAFDTDLRSPVALKIIKADRAGDTAAREHFLRRAFRAASEVGCPKLGESNFGSVDVHGSTCLPALFMLTGSR